MKAKMNLHKLLSLLLALVMVVGLLPAMSLTGYAEGETLIDEVRLKYDTSKVILNTAYTEGEVQTLLRQNLSSATDGVKVVDTNNIFLMYPKNSSYYGIGDGTSQISDSREYYVELYLNVVSGYDWAVKESNTTSITFYLNGFEATLKEIIYGKSSGKYRVLIKLGTPSTDAIVKSVSIHQTDVSVQTGDSFNFTATVAGTVTDKTVTWSVSGAKSSETKISNAGELTVGSDETAKTVTVTATSNADSTKSASREVTITAAPLTIDSVTVSPASKELYTGEICSFTATVTGTENDKSVTWSVTGQNSTTTTITSDGVLTIGTDETADNITVKAVAKADSNKYGEASVTVKQTVLIKDVKLTYDTSKVILSTTYTEGEVQTQLRQNISSATDGVKVVDTNNIFLMYPKNSSYYGIGDGTSQISDSREYYVELYLNVVSGYDWAVKESNTTSITFYLNGIEATVKEIIYGKSSGKYRVLIKLGTPSTDAIVKSVSIDQTDVSVQTGGSFSFTATVAGNITDKTVTWSVSGAKSSETKISDTGVLTVGSDETATTVTVTAKSNADNTKSGSREVTITAAHTHSLTKVNAKAPTCTENGNIEYYTCSGCSKLFSDATGSVEITDTTSVIISATNHTPSDWKSDADNHWKECTVVGCGVIIEDSKAAHTASDWITDTTATATTDGTKHKECTVCYRVLETGTIPATGSGEHTHSYGSDWKSDADKHWHECSCGDKSEEAPHTFKWVVDKEATTTEKGSKHEECEVCGYKKSAVEIPATGTPTNPPKPGNPDSPQTGDNSMMVLWITLLFVSAVGVVGTTVYSRKKKEQAE